MDPQFFSHLHKIVATSDKSLTALLQKLTQEGDACLPMLVEELKALKSSTISLLGVLGKPHALDEAMKARLRYPVFLFVRKSLDQEILNRLRSLQEDRIPDLLMSCAELLKSQTVRVQLLEELDTAIETLRELSELSEKAVLRLNISSGRKA